MPKLISSVIGKAARAVKGLFRGKGKKATPPRLNITGGHRGVAAGSLKPGEQDTSAANVKKWKTVDADFVENFIYFAEKFPVHSTNVLMMQYFIDDQELWITYKGGKKRKAGEYVYRNISPQEALQFAKAESKGGAVWDHLRVRGKGNAKKFKKPYYRLK